MVKSKYQVLSGRLDESTLRIWSAVEAKSLGKGGVTTVAKATGMSRTTIYVGLKELALEAKDTDQVFADKHKRKDRRVRAVGGGRKKLTDIDESLLSDLNVLVEPTTRGDPTSPLRWTCKSTAKLAAELNRQGHKVSPRSVNNLLYQLGYSLQSTRKTREGGKNEDRNAQFHHISETVAIYQAAGEPVISVDTKKNEKIGDFENAGQEWQPVGMPEEVRIYDFIDPEQGKVSPYGVYDLTNNTGWVNVGIDHDTAEFAVESIRRWWHEMGKPVYSNARRLLITADCGGSNGYRVRLWRRELQKLADEENLSIQVCHFPPGTSKWNKIEHRMFCNITANWRGRPLISREVIVNLIGNTTTKTGLRIKASLDENKYQQGIKVSDNELAMLNIERDDFHGEWNYKLDPRNIILE